MTTKLTAKLSDGREYEVASEWTAKESDGYVFFVLKPLKRESREWFEVRTNEDRIMELSNLTEAQRVKAMYASENSKIYLVREVLE